MSRRLFDLSLVLSALPLALPLLLVAGLAIWLDTGRPIVYRSVRVGRSGRSFGMLRFRTVDLAVAAELPLEQRLSRAGRWIRDVSLDDLPNLFNVLAGDISLVGPRPTQSGSTWKTRPGSACSASGRAW
jgi:lipopolysaccharide/colanic/teichoic acid biosynthesis glycosyltransferase